MKDIKSLIRTNIQKLKPYSSARDEYSGAEAVFLDANENPFNAPYNRYPDPYQRKLKAEISKIKGVPEDAIFLGNGSDEPIDLLYRVFCEPGVDNVVMIDPSYGMYQVAADINNVEIRKVLLTDDFQLDVDALLKACDEKSKLLFICSPNNPTGNCFQQDDMLTLIEGFEGIVVLDEAYIDFAPDQSLLKKIQDYPNLVVLQTFSKAWGMAGIRLGMAFASVDIITVLSHVKYPYNINMLTQQKAFELIQNVQQKEEWVDLLIKERKLLVDKLKAFNFIYKIYPTDSNFILVKAKEARVIYDFLVDKQVIIRDRSKVVLCDDCLRITVGAPSENEELLSKLKAYEATL